MNEKQAVRLTKGVTIRSFGFSSRSIYLPAGLVMEMLEKNTPINPKYEPKYQVRKAGGKRCYYVPVASVELVDASLLPAVVQVDVQAVESAIAVLNAALAAVRQDYITRYIEYSLMDLRQLRVDLAAVGMDLDKYAPHPSSRSGRKEYKQAQYKRSYASQYFKSVASSLRYNDPHIVVEIPDSESRLRSSATMAANAEVDGYIRKLAAKIGKSLKSAKVSGRLWDGSILTVECADGVKQVWSTKCILNRSVYNLIFNQWPTRKVS